MIVEERTYRVHTGKLADAGWKDLLKRLTPMLHTQRNRILIPTDFSPIR